MSRISPAIKNRVLVKGVCSMRDFMRKDTIGKKWAFVQLTLLYSPREKKATDEVPLLHSQSDVP